MAGAVDTLFIPHRTGVFQAPEQPWLFFNAALPHGPLPLELTNWLRCEQGWRGNYLQLENAGLNVSPTLAQDTPACGALVLLTKHKRENFETIERANKSVLPNGPILVAGDKNLGISSVRKWVAKSSPIEGSIAKHHATVFWFAANPNADFTLPEKTKGVERFETAPGMFSPDKIDTGSELLASFINEEIRGDIADFGAGWAYLSSIVAQKGRVRSLALYEAHWASLETAKRNLKDVSPAPTFNWVDVASEIIGKKFDWIVMNPPFHSGRKSEPKLGERFIEIASTCLKKNGQLLMVANTNLPYEQVLSARFVRSECLTVQSGFKVLRASL